MFNYKIGIFIAKKIQYVYGQYQEEKSQDTVIHIPFFSKTEKKNRKDQQVKYYNNKYYADYIHIH